MGGSEGEREREKEEVRNGVREGVSKARERLVCHTNEPPATHPT